MNEREAARTELDLVDLIDMIWIRWRAIGVFALVSVAIGAIAYLVVTPRYQSEAEITPLSRAKFAEFADLIAIDRFKYTPATLANDFTKYLVDQKRLGLAKNEVKAPDIRTEFRVKEDTSTDRNGNQLHGLVSLHMTATFRDGNQLDTFMADAIKRAKQDFATDIRNEIQHWLAATEDKKAWKIKSTEVLISAERGKFLSERHDSIEQLQKEALVARAVGLDRPLEFRAQTLDISRTPASSPLVQQFVVERPVASDPPTPATPPPLLSLPSTSNLPKYSDGYLVLEERASLLEARKNDDPFIPRLRDLQKEVFLLKSDLEGEQVKAILDRSVLSSPDQADFVSYNLVHGAIKVFPRPMTFVGLALVFGLGAGMFGAILAGLREAKRRSDGRLRESQGV